MTSGPLGDLHVLVTRPAANAGELRSAIEEAGGTAVAFPVLEIVPRDRAELEAEFAAQKDPDIAIFVSRNAVDNGLPVVRGRARRIAAIGPATASALHDAGVAVDITPEDGSSSEFLLAHHAMQDCTGKAITIVRGSKGRDLLAKTLRSRGADVVYLSAYERRPCRPGDAEQRAVQDLVDEDRLDCVSIMSVATLEALLDALPDSGVAALRKTLLVAPSERVIQTAQNLIPGAATLLAPGPRAHDIVAALIAHKQSGQI